MELLRGNSFHTYLEKKITTFWYITSTVAWVSCSTRKYWRRLVKLRSTLGCSKPQYLPLVVPSLHRYTASLSWWHCGVFNKRYVSHFVLQTLESARVTRIVAIFAAFVCAQSAQVERISTFRIVSRSVDICDQDKRKMLPNQFSKHFTSWLLIDGTQVSVI